jgi:four helix bundle protein
MKDFRELGVWRKAHELTLEVYRITAAFPSEERYGLTRQLRRCSASIAANLAEGCGRTGDAEFARFCTIAMGSASELEYHLLLAKDLQLISPKAHQPLSSRTTEVKRMLSGMLKALKPPR